MVRLVSEKEVLTSYVTEESVFLNENLWPQCFSGASSLRKASRSGFGVPGGPEQRGCWGV